VPGGSAQAPSPGSGKARSVRVAFDQAVGETRVGRCRVLLEMAETLWHDGGEYENFDNAYRAAGTLLRN
jgi:hypothetical protein